MIEPMLSLAFAIHSKKGVHALLLGSGISRSAGIPTGWEITLDLVQKMAQIKGKSISDPVALCAWYSSEYGNEPDYCKLIADLAKSEPERRQLLRGYFEPTEDEKEQGFKQPTNAHRKIAELIAKGYIHIVLTTNFDRLLEQALKEIGIEPTVIATADQAKGALPLAHQTCCIIKIHGDYLDTELRNTPDEVAQYDEEMNRLLDQIFDEYGQIVCGWSAEYDKALREAIERCLTRRFTTYWTVKDGLLMGEAEHLIRLRQAEKIDIADADSFFNELTEKVLALEEIQRYHPLSAEVAVARLKRYIGDDRFKVQTDDIVIKERNRVLSMFSQERNLLRGTISKQDVELRLQQYEADTEILRALLITGCYWGNERNHHLWAECLRQIATPCDERGGVVLQSYPAILLTYASCIAAIANNKYDTLRALLVDAHITSSDDSSIPFAIALYEWQTNYYQLNLSSGYHPNYPYLSKKVMDILRNQFREIIPLDQDYQVQFDLFEFLFSLICVDQGETSRPPVGLYFYPSTNGSTIKIIGEEIARKKDDWEPLKSGLFGGSVDRLIKAINSFKEITRQYPRY